MLIARVFTNIVAASIEVLILCAFLSIFGELKNKKTLILSSIFFIVINVSTLMLISIKIIFIICTLSIIFMFSLQYKISWFKRIFSTLLNFVLVVLFEMLIGVSISSILNISIEETQSNILTYLMCVTVSKLIIYVGVRILKYYIKPKKERVNAIVMLPFLLLPVTSLFILYGLSEFVLISNNTLTHYTVFVAGFLLICTNVAIFLIFDYVLGQKEKNNLAERQIMKLKLEQEYHTTLAEKQNEANKTIHDLKHKFYAIKELLSTDKDDAIKKINEMCQIFEGMSALKYIGIQSVDALINSKIQCAKEKDISVECKSIIMDVKRVDSVDLCVIFGNLLDNSIEACEKIEKDNKIIKIIVFEKGDYLSLTIINNVSKNYETKEKTSKKDKIMHGYGLDNVKEIIKKYDGIMNNGLEDGKYKVNVILNTSNK